MRKKIVLLLAFLLLLAIGILGYIEAILLGSASPSTGMRAAAWGVVALAGLVGATIQITAIVRTIHSARSPNVVNKPSE